MGRATGITVRDLFRFPERRLRRLITEFFLIGIIGMALPWTREFFIRQIPLTFIVCLAFLVLTDHTGNRKLYWISAVIFLTGWLAEVVGVNTGLLFGQYGYSLLLGPAIFGTPLVMGLSWLILVYLTAAVAQEFTMHPLYRTVLAAVLMVVFDFLLEPAAKWMKMWFWQNGSVPLTNYISWFLISLALLSLFPLFKIRIRNRIARRLFLTQMLFSLIMIVISWVENLFN